MSTSSSAVNTMINLADAASIECSLTYLTCGYNASGISAIVTVEKALRSGEKKICDRIFFNVGDSTQRFCSEHRVKFEAVSTIVITSLAPHNIAGFAGVFLSLSDKGAEELKVVGPSGTKLMLDVMMPFINRRFPNIICTEVEDEEVTLESIGGFLHVKPVFAEGLSMKSIAVVASFIPREFKLPKSSSHECDIRQFSFLPIACQFSLKHSTAELLHWCKGRRENILSRGKDIVTFIPLGSASHVTESCNLEFGQHLSVYSLDDGSEYNRLLDLCKQEDVLGLIYSNNLTKTCIEFQHTQITIKQLELICKPLFPNSLINTTEIQDQGNVTGFKDQEKLFHVYPMLEVRYTICSTITDHSSSTTNIMLTHLDYSFHSGMSFTKFSTKLGQRLAITNNYKKEFLSVCKVDVSQPPTSDLSISASPHLTSLAEEFQLRSTLNRDYKQSYWSENSNEISTESSTPTLSSSCDVKSQSANQSAADAFRSSLLKRRKMNSSHSNQIIMEALSSIDEGDQSKLICGTPISAMPSCVDNYGNIQQESSDSLLSEAPPARTLTHNVSYDRKNKWSPLAAESSGNSFNFEQSSSDTLGQTIVDMSCTAGVPPPNPFHDSFIVTLLGTGCATPSKHRSNSCIMVSLLKKKSCQDQVASTISEKKGNTPLQIEVEPPMLTLPNMGKKKALGLSLDLSLCNSEKEQNKIVKKKPTLSLDLDLCNQNKKRPRTSELPLDLEADDGQEMSGMEESCKQQQEEEEPENQIECNVLLDIGEGACSQIFQSVGGDLDRYDNILLSIKVVWISHHHADHATGFTMLMEHICRAKLRKQILTESFSHDINPRIPTYDKYHLRKQDFAQNKSYDSSKVTLIANEVILKYCNFALSVAGLDSYVNFYSITNTLYAGATTDIQQMTGGLVKKLSSVAVPHCQNAYGIVLDLASGQKIVFSGDCRPSQSLVKAGINCNLLIHEATFDDIRMQDALKKKHSTISEAVGIAKKMNAEHTILTHFSQRYPKSLDLSEAANSCNSSAQPSSASTGNIFSRITSSSKKPFGNAAISSFTPSPSMELRGELNLELNDMVSPSTEFESSTNNMNVSMSYDFMRVAYPSQFSALPNATKEVAKSFCYLEERLADNLNNIDVSKTTVDTEDDAKD